MFFVEDMVVLSIDQKKAVDCIMEPFNPTVPFYLSDSTPNRKAFIHRLMNRNLNNPTESGEIISTLFNPFYEIFIKFCSDNQIEVKKVLRAAVNYSIHYKGMTALPHVDHRLFDHCNFLLYLTDCRGGETNIYDQRGDVLHKIYPQKNKAVIFSGEYHSISEFEPGQDRMVVVFTFIKNN